MIDREAKPPRTTVPQRERGCMGLVGEQLASCPLGQILFRGADRLLWTVEASVQWFVESKDLKDCSVSESNPRPQPVRPLPWVFFLPLLLCLRLVKNAAEMVAFLKGREPPRPLQVVRYLRVRRRRLRAVKYHGLRNFQSWQRAEDRHRQAEGKGKVMKVFCVDPLTKLATFTGLSRVFPFLNDAAPIQPSEEEESSEEIETEEHQTKAVIETTPKTVDQKSSEILASTSQDEKESDVVVPSVAASNQTTVATSDITFQQGKVETTDSDAQTITGTSLEDGAASADSAQYQSEESDDSSLSVHSTEACSGSTSQTFYSPMNSSCVTPEPMSSGSVTFAIQQETQAPESAETFATHAEIASEVRPLELPRNVMPLPDFTKCSGPNLSGKASSSKDVGEDVKVKSKFSNFFQIKKKSQSRES